MTGRALRLFCVIIRGPAGAGKSTLARAVQAELSTKVAVIDTDIFNWQIVPGEEDKEVVYDNTVSLATHYIGYGYSVIIEGLILTGEEGGAIARLRRIARGDRATLADFYCSVPKAEAVRRSERRERQVSRDKISAWWDLAEEDKQNVEWPLIDIDMTVEVSESVSAVLAHLTTLEQGSGS